MNENKRVEIIKTAEGTWRIENGFVRFFLLEGRERALLIDSGATAPDAAQIAAELTDLPLTLVNTHGDGDHTSGNGAFAAYYVHPADAEGCGLTVKFPQAAPLPLGDGDEIDLGGRTLRCVHIPGHTRGSIALLDVSARVLYAGDSVQNGHIYMFGAHRAPDEFEKSLIKLADLRAEYDRICPSHGDAELPPEAVDTVLAAWRKCCRGELPVRSIFLHGHEVLSADGDGCGFFIAP